HGGDSQLLANFQALAEMIVVRCALLTLGKQQTSLVGAGRRGQVAIFQQLARVCQAMLFQVRFQLGEPDLHALPACIGKSGQVLGKRTWHRASFADAELHSLTSATCFSATSANFCQKTRTISPHAVPGDLPAYARPA